MESVDRTIWDEWGAMQAEGQARDEAAGSLTGFLSARAGMSLYFFLRASSP